MTSSPNRSIRVDAFGDRKKVARRHVSGIVSVGPDEDSDTTLVESMARALPGWTLERVESGAEALERASESFDACLLDRPLAPGDGFEVLCRARSAGYSGPVIVLSAAREQEANVRADDVDTTGVHVIGAVRADDLEHAVRSNVAQRRLVVAQVACADAEAATREMDELVATLSHELRAPLHTMRLAIEALGAEELGSAERGRAKVLLERGLGRLSRTVEDLLDAAQAERGELTTRREPVDLAEVAHGAITSMRAIHPTLRLSLDASEARILGDAGRLEQVVENLIGNAFRHAKGAHVTVHVRVEGNDVVLLVEDDGPGFPPTLLERVFERFSKGDLPHERGGGLGLGLAIVRAIADAHEAPVIASNDGPGGGARVTLRFARQA